MWRIQALTDFNSRPREGANSFVPARPFPGCKFQFPPPRGGELLPAKRRLEAANFNSRPREGANHGSIPWNIHRNYFNSRPREGANGRRTLLNTRRHNFNSRPREGANGEWLGDSGQAEIFQFPPPRGGERLFYSSEIFSSYFNSRPREGANLRWWQRCSWPCQISIPAPARGRT